MEAGAAAATQSVLQHAGDDELTPTEHVAKAQRLGDRPTRGWTKEIRWRRTLSPRRVRRALTSI